jgi:hypothetical protein
LDPIA